MAARTVRFPVTPAMGQERRGCPNRGDSSIIVSGGVIYGAAHEPMKEAPMEYILMLYVNEAGWPKLTKAEQEQGMAAYIAYTEALTKADVFAGVIRLRPSSTATTVRVANGKSHVMDGPYVDSREQLSGYFIIDVADLEAAISWAARCPAASHGAVEVRPIWGAPA